MTDKELMANYAMLARMTFPDMVSNVHALIAAMILACVQQDREERANG